MADNTINVRIKDRSDTEANWTSKNPVLLKGERAITDGTGKYKIGDGKNTWSALPYYEAMTSADRTKLNGIASGANKTTVDSSLSSSSTNPVQNKVVNSALAGKSNTNHTHDLSTMINTLSIDSSTPTDDDYFVSQYAGGGTTTTTYHRRPVKALLEYIKKGLAKVATSGSYNDLSNKPTIPSVGNGTITIKQAGAVKGSFTTNQSGATTIELTDNNTNTWRGIQDNLTSSSTTDSLSAAQGKVLNDKFASYVPASRTVNGKALSANISLNASDVGASASGHTHNYVKDAGNNSSNTTFAYSKAGMNYGDYAWLAGWNGYELRAVAKSQFATAGHTHNYAGSNSAGGSANSAVKLATARTVSNTEDFVMSFSYDGSANSNASLRYYNSSISVGNTNNYPYHRFAKIDTQTSSYIDKTSTFLITQDYNGGGWGIVRISLQTNNSSSVSTVEAKWLARCDLKVDCVQIGLYNVFGKTYADAFFKTSGTYAGTVIRNLASGARGNISRTWTLINSAEANGTTTSDKKASTESYVSTSAAATTLHSQAYTSVVVASDGGTVSYANSAGNASKVNNYTVNSNVPSGAKFTDTVYSHPTTSGNKHIPSGGSSGQILRWSSDGTAVWGNDNNTTYTLSSITGTLAVSKGGTGSATAARGRFNLGAVGFVCQSTEPSGQNNGDIWFKEE
jgi:hypothetical protein